MPRCYQRVRSWKHGHEGGEGRKGWTHTTQARPCRSLNTEDFGRRTVGQASRTVASGTVLARDNLDGAADVGVVRHRVDEQYGKGHDAVVVNSGRKLVRK